MFQLNSSGLRASTNGGPGPVVLSWDKSKIFIQIWKLKGEIKVNCTLTMSKNGFMGKKELIILAPLKCDKLL